MAVVGGAMERNTVHDGPRRAATARFRGLSIRRSRAMLWSVPVVLTAVWVVVGLVFYGAAAMMPNLIAGLASAPLDFIVATVVVDRVLSSRQRREWDFASRELSKRASEAFVDIMRLIYVGETAEALRYNIARYAEFVSLAERHLGDLRSHVESSATVFGPHTYERCRRVERRLSWCLDRLRPEPGEAKVRPDLLSLMERTAVIVLGLLRDGGGYRRELDEAESAVTSVRWGRQGEDGRILVGRLEAQSLVLASLQSDTNAQVIRSIGEDVDGDFSIPYFMIDYVLLVGARTAAP